MPDLTVSADVDSFMQAGNKALAKQALESLVTASPSGTLNDWNPTGLTTASMLRLTPTGEATITGIAAPAGATTLLIHNDGVFGVTLKNQDAGSIAANRFDFGRDAYIAPGQSFLMLYDPTDARWEIAATTSVSSSMRSTLFGDGSDGDVVVSSGTTTLSRDMYYRNLTVSGTGNIVTNGWRIFVQQLLDLSAAPAGAIRWNGNNGGNANVATGGTAGAGLTNTATGGAGTAQAGATGSTGAGTQATNVTGATVSGGGGAGGCGAGGNGVNAGGASRNAVSPSNVRDYRRITTELTYPSGTTPPFAGQQSQAGSSGGGDGSVAGGGGGGGATSGGTVFIAARTILRDGGTAVGAIQAIGGNGGNGGNTSGGNTGGGSGGGGASGGFVYILAEAIVGSVAIDAIDVSGGNGGNGGNGQGTGFGGGGGGRGGAGRAFVWTVSLAILTASSASNGTNGTAQSGTTAGVAGSAAVTTRVSL